MDEKPKTKGYLRPFTWQTVTNKHRSLRGPTVQRPFPRRSEILTFLEIRTKLAPSSQLS